jgi:hypothetical protein
LASSHTLPKLVLVARNPCAAQHPEASMPYSAAHLEDRARKGLAFRRKPQSHADTSGENTALASQLWE